MVWRKQANAKVVYLTFDDGPHPQITPWVMDKLEEFGAKGTFFIVGENAEKYPNVLNEIANRGHSIGNHTQHHLKGWGVSATAYLKDIELGNKMLPEKRLFRPPHGRINFKAIKQLKDYEIVMWDVLSRDYNPRLDVLQSLKRIKYLTTKGSIAVFHDSEKAEKNLKLMLPNYLQFLRDNQFNMLPL